MKHETASTLKGIHAQLKKDMLRTTTKRVTIPMKLALRIENALLQQIRYEKILTEPDYEGP